MRRVPLIVAAATVLAHLVCIGQYGIFRDELYYLACGEHLDWGYVDQPPLIALVAWLVRNVLGESLFAIRILAVLAHAGIVLLTAQLARRFGGDAFAQSLAALCAAIAPVYLALGHFLSMNVFEPLFWMGCIAVAAAIFDGASERWWLLFGVLAGLGLQNKHATLFFGLAFAIGLAISPQRRTLLRPWIWLGGLVALLIFLPNLIWQIQHDFATVELLSNIARSTKNEPVTLLSFAAGQVLLMHPLAVPVWLAGLWWLLRSPRYSTFGWCWLALFAEFVILEGKVYYLSPAYPMLFAAGGVVFSRFRGMRPVVAAALVIGGVVLAPMALPILPVETFIRYQEAFGIAPPKTETHRLGALPQQYADMHGWPELAGTVARVYHSLSPEEQAKCAIFGQNYGQAGAIDFYGPRLGLPKAISAHQSYFLWGPRGYTGEVMIVLDDRRDRLEELFEEVHEVAVVRHPYAMPYENNKPVHLCRQPKVPLRELWPKIKKWI